jgi:hypothetical protein
VVSAAAADSRSTDRREIDGLGLLAGVRIQGINNPNRMIDRVPTVSLTHDRVTPAVMARALAGDGVFVWSGHNYALEVVRHLGIDENRGVLRIGLVHYNTDEDVDRTLASLDEVLRVRPETYSVFSKPCVRGPGRRDGRRDAGASQGRLDAPGREHKAPVGRAGRVPLRRRRPSTMLQHRLRRVSWRGHPSNSLKTRYMSPDGL